MKNSLRRAESIPFFKGIFLLVLITGCGASKPVFDTPSVIIDHPPEVRTEPGSGITPDSPTQPEPTATSSTPPSLLIKVPFAPQSPFANWDALHEEACEEMALIMVHHYLTGEPLSLEQAEKEIQEMIAWETDNGYAYDVSVSQLGNIATSLYNSRARIIRNVTAESLRKELAAGNPVIIPAAGRMLKNPYFSGAGPFYHMLVVTGYNDKGFITNEPGTKRGEEYFYPTDVLMDAIHDWTGIKEETYKGEKNALVLDS